MKFYPSKKFLATLLIATQLIASIALAWPPTFGIEYNFTSAELKAALTARTKSLTLKMAGVDPQIPDESEQAAVDAFMREVKKSCFPPDCNITDFIGKFNRVHYRIRFKNGFGFDITTDPSVVEIITLPATLAQIQENEGLAQKFIFDVAATLGLSGKYGKKSETSAHFNTGVKSAYEDDPIALLRYYTDYAKRPLLGLGIFGETINNAPPLVYLPMTQQAELEKLTGEANAKHLKTIGDIATIINRDVHRRTLNFQSSPTSGAHYQALGMKYLAFIDLIPGDKPYEMRAARQPPTAKEFPLMAELQQKKIALLKRQHQDIVYIARAPYDYETKEAKFTPKRKLAEAAHAYLYVDELGESWEKYQTLFNRSIVVTLKEIPVGETQGIIQRVFSGHIDWTNENEVFLFEEVLARDVLISPYFQDKFIEVLAKSAPPPEVMSKIETALAAQLSGAPKAVSRPLERMMARMKAYPLDPAHFDWKFESAVEESFVKPLSPLERMMDWCSRALSGRL
jgi:hypothetical protein